MNMLFLLRWGDGESERIVMPKSDLPWIILGSPDMGTLRSTQRSSYRSSIVALCSRRVPVLARLRMCVLYDLKVESSFLHFL